MNQRTLSNHDLSSCLSTISTSDKSNLSSHRDVGIQINILDGVQQCDDSGEPKYTVAPTPMQPIFQASFTRANKIWSWRFG